jgi:alpha-glucosidase
MPRTGWRGAAIYQVYLRSFADGNGDGEGDLAGLRARLSYLADLGVNAIWLNPWYPSPMADGGYDVADYRGIAPVFGTLAEAEKLICEAHELGIRVIIDVVPNHGSDQQAWFREALAAGPGSAARRRFWFRPGRGDEPPNDWRSIFGGPAWTRVPDGEWYLHLFAPEQPDFNWNNPEVVEEFHDVLRFWFRRGVDGIRIDSAALLIKDPDAPPDGLDPYTDRDGVHEIYRGWRRVAGEFGDDRILIGEVWLPDQERFARYLRPDEMHTAFNFDFLACSWDAAALRRVIDTTLATHGPLGAPPTWVLSNHDVTRPVTRYGRADTSFAHGDRKHGMPSDPELGRRRPRAAAVLGGARPGGLYVYRGV